MATFLDLTNKVLVRLNEVELNSTNFAGATGFQLQAQHAVLDAVREINSDQYAYPWQHVTKTQTLSAGVVSYALDTTLYLVDWATFQSLPNFGVSPPMTAKSLRELEYHRYMQETFPQDQNAISQAVTTSYRMPDFVIEDEAGNFIVSPVPDRGYVVQYEGWAVSNDMVAYSDVCPIPDRFTTVVVDNAMKWAYLFRENLDAYDRIKVNADKGIEDIRRQASPPFKSVRDTRAGPQFYNYAFNN